MFRDFRYSIARVLSRVMPFIVGGVWIALSQTGGGRLLAILGCLVAILSFVFLLRVRIRCLQSGVEVRYLQRAHRFEAGSTVETSEVVVPFSRSEILTLRADDRRARSVSLGFFPRRIRPELVTAVKTALTERNRCARN